MPKKRAGETDEQKEKKFQEWKAGPEYAAIEDFIKAKEADPEIKEAELATRDIWQDWTEVLNKLWAMAKTLKTPMKSKSRCKCSLG